VPIVTFKKIRDEEESYPYLVIYLDGVEVSRLIVTDRPDVEVDLDDDGGWVYFGLCSRLEFLRGLVYAANRECIWDDLAGGFELEEIQHRPVVAVETREESYTVNTILDYPPDAEKKGILHRVPLDPPPPLSGITILPGEN
jgi:hypothetical protein